MQLVTAETNETGDWRFAARKRSGAIIRQVLKFAFCAEAQTCSREDAQWAISHLVRADQRHFLMTRIRAFRRHERSSLVKLIPEAFQELRSVARCESLNVRRSPLVLHHRQGIQTGGERLAAHSVRTIRACALLFVRVPYQPFRSATMGCFPRIDRRSDRRLWRSDWRRWEINR